MRVIFGEYTPDQPAHLNSGLLTADGVYAIANGYAPVRAFAAAQNGTLPARALGAAAYRVETNVYLFAATASDIFRYQPGGYTSLKSGMTSNPAIGVRFTPYAKTMLATNGQQVIQRFDPSTPTTFNNLSASAPTARYIAVVKGFVVAGYAAGNAARLAWSDNGDPSEWTPGTREAGFFLMPGGGDITGVVGGEYGLIFQENRVLRMTYTADDTIWQFDEIATDVGCIAPKSIATYGKITFFLSNKGLMACDGINVQSIGSEKVDRTFLSLVDRTYLDAMTASVDPRNSLYYISVPASDPPTQSFVYNYALQRWTTAKITAELVFPALAQGSSLDDLDALYGSLENMPLSLDSDALRGGYPALMLYDGLHRLGALSGPSLEATLSGPQGEMMPGMKARMRSVRPVTDARTVTMRVAGANAFGQTPVETAYATRTSAGVYRTRENWNLYQITTNIPAGVSWTYVQGYDAEAVPGGRA